MNMKKIYIAPLLEIEEVEELCETLITATNPPKVETPGPDTYVPVDPFKPIEEEEEDPNPA